MRFLVENESSTFEVSPNDASESEDGVVLSLNLNGKPHLIALEQEQVTDLINQLKAHFLTFRGSTASSFLTWVDGHAFGLDAEDVIDLCNVLKAYQASFVSVGGMIL